MASQEPVIRWVEINDDLAIALFPNPEPPAGAPPPAPPGDPATGFSTRPSPRSS